MNRIEKEFFFINLLFKTQISVHVIFEGKESESLGPIQRRCLKIFYELKRMRRTYCTAYIISPENNQKNYNFYANWNFILYYFQTKLINKFNS
jgi:hypothetical protein